MTITIDIKGTKEVADYIKKKGENALKNADAAVQEAALFLEGEIKMSIAGQKDLPVTVDTGRFLNSVTAEKTGIMTAEVSSDVEYGPLLENGTSRMEARPHFRQMMEVNKDKIVNFIKKAVEEA